MTRPIAIRDSTAADLPRLRDVFREASLGNAADRELLAAHPEVLELEPEPVAAGLVRVAVVDGEVAGFARLDVRGPAGTRTAELVDLFVDPQRQRAGVGRELVADALRIARAARVTAIEVDANPDAVGFYAAAGFVAVGSVVTPLGVEVPRLRLQVGAAGRRRRPT